MRTSAVPGCAGRCLLHESAAEMKVIRRIMKIMMLRSALFCAILAKAILPVSGGTVPTLAEKRVVETLWSATNYWQISEIDFRNCCATGLSALVK